MTYYNPNCTLTSRNCASGCCDVSGYCATITPNCVYKYSDFNNNSNYYFSGYANSKCTASSLNCQSGCCTTSGLCATTSSLCKYPYTDYYTNSSKYSYPNTSSTSPVNIGPIVGPIVGGVVLIIIIIVLVVKCKQRQAQ